MDAKEARKIFNDAISDSQDGDQIALLEILREYFTNPEFRKGLEDHTWAAKND